MSTVQINNTNPSTNIQIQYKVEHWSPYLIKTLDIQKLNFHLKISFEVTCKTILNGEYVNSLVFTRVLYLFQKKAAL